MVILVLIFWGPPILFSTVAAPVCISINSLWGFFFLASLPTPVISCVYDSIRYDRCKAISHCGFDLHVPDDEWCWAPFHVSVGHLYVFFGKKMSIQVLCPFYSCIVCVCACACVCVCWVVEVLYIVWILTPCWIYHLQLSFPFSEFAFSFCWCFPWLCKSFYFGVVPIVYFSFCFPWLERHIWGNVAKANIKEIIACVFL